MKQLPKELERIRIFNFFAVAEYIAENEGYDRDWIRSVLADFETGNDCYKLFFISQDEDLDSPFSQLTRGLVKYFDFREESEDYNGDEVLFEISW